MTSQDLIITPIFIVLILLVALLLRRYVTYPETRIYFLPALTAKLMGAIALGLIYQFYYNGGDTFIYFNHGSKWIWQAFQDDFNLGLRLLFDSGGPNRDPLTYQYNQHIWYYRDFRSFMVVRITSFIDLFTFHTYSSTALFYAVFSFSGLWAMYQAIYEMYGKVRFLHLGILFIPSAIFWGSGILKDTLTIGALGWLVYCFINLIALNRRKPLIVVVLLAMSYLIYLIKSYILVCFLPTVFVWLYFERLYHIRNKAVRILIAPLFLLFFTGVAYAITTLAAGESYQLDTLANQAAVTAYDIRYGWGARTQGDGGYDLGGVPDGSLQSMIRLMPAAINVSLFRPYLWEAKNPLMLLSALEALLVLILTIRLFFARTLKHITKDPFLIFCVLFALLFAFAVGVSTYNFGTLSRYKLPMVPLYMSALIILLHKVRRAKS